MPARTFRLEYIFVVIGVALLAGAAAAYEFSVRRPQTWPRTEAEVVGSRVINPKKPTTYSPEIQFRYHIAGGAQEVTIVPNWSSSSYDMVRSYVSDYPVGRRVTVAVNPVDPRDIRHELGLTLLNLLFPGVLATLGMVFSAVGLIAGRRGPRLSGDADQPGSAAPVPAEDPRTARRVGLIFVVIGVFCFGLGIVLLRNELGERRDWPVVDATVVASQVLVGRSSRSGSGSSRQTYDAQVTFRYTVEGAPYESTTTSGSASSSRSAAETLVAKYAPGSAQVISVRPDDPNIIRFEMTSTSGSFWIAVAMMAMGLIFAGAGGVVWRSARRPRAAPLSMADIEREDELADRFGPRT
jgi:hypothetical protein